MAKQIKPTVKDVVRYRDAMNNSLMNGSNQHLNSTQSLYSNAKLYNNKTGELLINYKAPMFEVI